MMMKSSEPERQRATFAIPRWRLGSDWSGGHGHRWRQPRTSLHKAFEQLGIEGGRRVGFGVPLNGDAEPVRIDRFHCLDDAVGGDGGDAEARADLLDGLMVIAVDEQFRAAVDFFEPR